MATLREYLNAKIKSKGSSMKAEKAKASKYKSIAAAKKAGALYYTNKDGKVMAAVYAEDLKNQLRNLLHLKRLLVLKLDLNILLLLVSLFVLKLDRLQNLKLPINAVQNN